MSQTKTLEEFQILERDYLLRKTKIVPTTNKKVSTLREEYEAERNKQIDNDEKRYVKQRADQEARNSEFAKENKLADPSMATTIVANKVVDVMIPINIQKPPETLLNVKEPVFVPVTEPVAEPKMSSATAKVTDTTTKPVT